MSVLRFGQLWMLLAGILTCPNCVTSVAELSLKDDIGDGAVPRVDYVRINLTTSGCANASFVREGPLTAPFEFSTGVTPDWPSNISYEIEFDGCHALIEYDPTVHPNPKFRLRFSRTNTPVGNIEMRGVNGARLTFSVTTNSLYVKADTQLGFQASNPMTCMTSTPTDGVSNERAFQLSLCRAGDTSTCEIYVEVPSNSGCLLVEHATKPASGATPPNAARAQMVPHGYWLVAWVVFLSATALLLDVA